MTAAPMFCLQILRRDVGYDTAFVDERCWHDLANDAVVYDDDPDFQHPSGADWVESGYVDRWETVMVAFTEQGLLDYMDLDGHNVEVWAFRGQWRIYVESFNRCQEMLDVRNHLMAMTEQEVKS